jgi:subtilisin family serine protease
MKKCVLTSIVPLVLTIAVGLPVVAGEIAPKYAAYLETLGGNDFASAIIYLEERPDIGTLDRELRAEDAPMSVRHKQVLNTLQEAAERSQPALLDYLDERIEAGSVKGYTPYWITNMVVVSATKGELQRIAQRADVEAIEPNFRVTLIEEVDQPYTPQKAGIGVTLSLQAINADRVWNELGYTGAGRLAANLDTGVDGDHPALTARWRGNWHPWYECWRDALGTGTQYPVDNHGHGTHTMGTICGAGHGTGDTVGVAFEAQWIADNSINQGVGPEFDNDVLGAFQWFADPDGDPGTTDDVPDVVQNSWGIDGRFGYDYEDCDYRWQEAIENCEAAGVVVTFSAGNEGPGAQTHRSPANICNTPTVNFSVGAVDCENYGWPYPIASFSSRGPSDCDGVTIKPEVAAPGVSVYSSYRGGGYTRMSGTSMAGPHVAGVVVLMRQANPNADVQTIKEVLMSTAHDLGSTGEDNTYGWGFIDAYEAVLAVSEPDIIPPEVTVTAPNGGEVLDVGSVYTITWDATDNVGVTSTSVYYSYDGGANYNLIQNLSGNPGYYDWTVPNTPSTNCLVKVYAYDAAENEGSDVSDGYFTIQGDVTPPEVTVTAPNGGETLTIGSVYTITWIATDNVGVTFTSVYYSYDGGANYNFIESFSGNPGSYDWTVPNTPSNSCLVKVYAYDAAGYEGSDVSDGYFTIEEGVAQYVWVQSIDLSLVNRGPWINARAEVLIWDQDNNPVSGAEVHSHWAGLTTDSDVFSTKRKGTGSCDSDKLRGAVGWWYYYVDDVVVPGYQFRDDLGETSDSIYAY